MIFVTVGNASQGFKRLLDAIDALTGGGLFGTDSVFIQAGNNPGFRPNNCGHMPFLSMDEFQEYIAKADLVVTHGGCGTLLHAVRLGKVPVVMPRRRKYNEIVNDHQEQLVQALAAEGRVIPAYEPEDLPRAIEEARRRNRQPVPPMPSRMLSFVAQAIEELIGKP